MRISFAELRNAKNFRHRGVTLIGYGLIVALLSIAAMGATSQAGRHLADCVFPAISSALDGDGFRCQVAGPGGPGDPGDPGVPGDPGDEDDDIRIAFAPVHDAEPGSLVISLPATARGFQGNRPASVYGPAGSDPEFSVDGGAWVTSGEVSSDASVRLRAQAPSGYNDQLTVAFELGGTTASWLVTSGAEIGAPQWLRDPELPKGYLSLDGYELEVKAQADAGNSIAFYEFLGGNIPPGMSYMEEGSILSGTPTELGAYSFTLAVEDNDGRRNEREFSLNVEEAPPFASTISPDNINVTRTADGSGENLVRSLFDGVKAGGVTLGTQDLYVHFNDVVLLDQIHWNRNRTGDRRYVRLEALVDGDWRNLVTTHESEASDLSQIFTFHGRVATQKLRIPAAANVVLRTLDFGVPNPPPAWVTPGGNLTIVDGAFQTFQLEAKSNSPWGGAGLTFEVASNVSIPEGITLSDSGLLEIAESLRLDDQLQLSIHARDGMGFSSSQTFTLLPNVPFASAIPPEEINVTRTFDGSGDNLVRSLFDGVKAGGVTLGSQDLYVHFNDVVLLDQVHWSRNYTGDRRYVRLEALVDGEWRNLVTTYQSEAGDLSRIFEFRNQVATKKLRIPAAANVVLRTLDFGRILSN